MEKTAPVLHTTIYPPVQGEDISISFLVNVKDAEDRTHEICAQSMGELMEKLRTVVDKDGHA